MVTVIDSAIAVVVFCVLTLSTAAAVADAVASALTAASAVANAEVVAKNAVDDAGTIVVEAAANTEADSVTTNEISTVACVPLARGVAILTGVTTTVYVYVPATRVEEAESMYAMNLAAT